MGGVGSRPPHQPSQNFLRNVLLSETSYTILPFPLPFTGVRLCLFLPFIIHKSLPNKNTFHVESHLFLRKSKQIWISLTEQFTDFQKMSHKACGFIQCNYSLNTLIYISWGISGKLQAELFCTRLMPWSLVHIRCFSGIELCPAFLLILMSVAATYHESN